MNQVIWIKINDTLGFSGVSMGTSPKDVDNHIDFADYQHLLGCTYEELETVVPGNWYDETLINFLAIRGWKYKSEWERDNGDVHAPCFERIK